MLNLREIFTTKEVYLVNQEKSHKTWGYMLRILHFFSNKTSLRYMYIKCVQAIVNLLNFRSSFHWNRLN